MKGLIELSNFPNWPFSSKWTIPSQTEHEGKVKVKMYKKGMAKKFNISQDDFTVGFKVDLSQICKARRAASFY